MKSLFRVAPELPPPPYTWLITTCACAAQTPQDNSKASASRRANLFIETPLVRMILPMGRSPHRECPIVPQHDGSRMTRRGVTGFVAKMNAWPSTTTNARSKTRSEKHTSELQSLMRIPYAVFCLKQKKQKYET